MSEELEIGGMSEGGADLTQEQIEQFQEQMRRASAALKQLQKDEGKSQKRDDSLAGLLSGFVRSHKDENIMQLIVMCLTLGMPTYFIVGILSLHYDEIYNELAKQLNKEVLRDIEKKEEKLLGEVEQEEKQLTKRAFHEHHLPEELKQRINEWVKDILILSLENVEKTLEAVYPESNLHDAILQLTAKILEKHLESENIEGEFDRIRSFSQFVLEGIGKELMKAGTEKHIEEKIEA